MGADIKAELTDEQAETTVPRYVGVGIYRGKGEIELTAAGCKPGMVLYAEVDQARAVTGSAVETSSSRVYTAGDYVGNGPLPNCDECHNPYSDHGQMDECPPENGKGDEPAVMGKGAGPSKMPTALDAIEAHVRQLQKLCDETGCDHTALLLRRLRTLPRPPLPSREELAVPAPICNLCHRAHPPDALGEWHACLEHLTQLFAAHNDEICQIAGKALGYPWFKDDQKNFPGATVEDGVCVGDHVAESIVEELARRYREKGEQDV